MNALKTMLSLLGFGPADHKLRPVVITGDDRATLDRIARQLREQGHADADKVQRMSGLDPVQLRVQA